MKRQIVFVFLFLLIALFAGQTALAAEDRLLYNRGAELAAEGHFEEAETELRQAAAVRNRNVAAKALSLLGQIAVNRSKKLLAGKPEETASEDRQKILEQMTSAENYFTESLSLKQNEEERKYLETVRAWRNKMTADWSAFDREQNRKKELQQQIQNLADWEEQLSEKIDRAKDEADSPRKSQNCYETGKEQKVLAEELALLQKMPPDNTEMQEQWKRLPAVAQTAEEAAALLAGHQPEQALTKQREVLDYLRSLIKPQQNQQNNTDQQQNQDQKQQDQDQKPQDQQQQPQDQKPQKNEPQNDHQANENRTKPEQEKEQKQMAEDQHKETAEEKAERLLKLVRRKQQQADKRREEMRAALMQNEPVNKDW
ncbi:MAG: hypothetical protein LBH00_05860 [Planctomycetaceae bacterium]|jgi:hypothetical protein|nr:hypothetical protein [Planctomycetaceae bacterium]